MAIDKKKLKNRIFVVLRIVISAGILFFLFKTQFNNFKEVANTFRRSNIVTLTMVFKLTIEAAKTWKKLKGHKLILLVLENKKFVDGELAEEVAA